jgi:RNA polymerase sigma-70 factor, ECF subfamily
MIDVLVADLATETVDVGIERTRKATVEQRLIDDLVQATVAGSVAARDQLLAEIHALALRYCRNRLPRDESVLGSANDVAQEVCLAVVTALRTYVVSGQSFRAFVFGITAHKVADAYRAIGRNRTDPTPELPEGPVLHDGPEQRLLGKELTERLGTLLQVLTARQRQVLVLRIAVGLSAEETAKQLGSTPGAVRVTQHRALDRLRATLSRASLNDVGDGGASDRVSAGDEGTVRCAIDRVAELKTDLSGLGAPVRAHAVSAC